MVGPEAGDIPEAVDSVLVLMPAELDNEQVQSGEVWRAG